VCLTKNDKSAQRKIHDAPLQPTRTGTFSTGHCESRQSSNTLQWSGAVRSRDQGVSSVRRKCRTDNVQLQTPYPGSHDRRLDVSSACSNSDLDRNKSSNSTTFQDILAPIYIFQLPGHDWLPLSSIHNSTLRGGRAYPCNIHHSSTTPTRQLAVINVCLPPVK
jgi:hypothetical protein